MTNELLLQGAELYVRRHFATKVKKIFTYHNISHTEGVVNAAMLMGSYAQLPEEELLTLLLAAWFHDTGFSQGKPENHEDESQLIAGNFLRQKETPDYLIEKVNNCIAATKIPQTPKNMTEQIICDADLYHLGTRDFMPLNKLLRIEIMGYSGEKIGKKEWRNSTIKFMEQHRYFSEYARTKLDPIKQQNLQQLVEKEIYGKGNKAGNSQALKENPGPVVPATNVRVERKVKIGREKKHVNERGVATMFRIISNNHLALSQMADHKANIMISVNTIALSILVTGLFNKLQNKQPFIIPAIILTGFCLTATVLAILSTRPTIKKSSINAEDIHLKKPNLLFFGSFFNLELPDYDNAMKEMMNDREYLYSSLIKDVFSLGHVLAKKYKLLRYSYNIFMVGIVIGIVSFIVAFLISSVE